MKCNQSRPGFELVSPCSFSTTITITPRAPPRYFNSKLCFLFKIIILEFIVLSKSSLPHFYALLKRFLWDAPNSRHCATLDGIYDFKTFFLDDLFKLGKKNKITQNKIRCIGRLFQFGNISLCQKLRNAQHIQSCHFTVKSSVIIFQTLSFFMSSFLAIIRTVKRGSPYTTWSILLTLTSVLLVESHSP